MKDGINGVNAVLRKSPEIPKPRPLGTKSHRAFFFLLEEKVIEGAFELLRIRFLKYQGQV